MTNYQTPSTLITVSGVHQSETSHLHDVCAVKRVQFTLGSSLTNKNHSEQSEKL